ncbi:MAG: iron-sulfur cluster insertion protein ErpA [Rhodospirillales bacterium CG15_BIG_FIL_POST_REV_8_21_14_020_66_15]|nr:MAG: iron-sulfur cluster insertion protein ErpA [Rhodospirillales bacterium CG15_BIG_FIL_POST_REV_8_21_14_020_66_15]
MPDGTPLAPEEGILISDSAATRIGQLRDMDGNPDLMLRVAVTAGGCSGFSYGFDLDDKVNDDDLVFEKNGIKVVVDETSLDLLKGSELDFKEDLIGSYFQMANPNANVTCGCGSSFGV